MDDRQVLLNLLKQMGENADDVAATLRAAQIKGVRNAVRFLNPVVRYLQDTLRYDNVEADVMTGRTLRLKGGGIAKAREVDMPEGVESFIRSFNCGNYPDLELDK